MTEQNQNELAPTNNVAEVIERENDQYVIVKDAEGKFKRKAKFKDYSSIKAETREEKIWLMNLLEGDEEVAVGLKENVGAKIEVADVIIRSYDRINEDNGQQEHGALTYLITPEKQVFVTSSKTVYFAINRIMDLFGTPDSDEWENVKVKVGKEKGQNGDMIKIKMVG